MNTSTEHILQCNQSEPLAKDSGSDVECRATLGHRLRRWPKVNPLSPHDASKHQFTSLKTDLIFLQPTKSGQIHEYVYITHFTVQSIRATS